MSGVVQNEHTSLLISTLSFSGKEHIKTLTEILKRERYRIGIRKRFLMNGAGEQTCRTVAICYNT